MGGGSCRVREPRHNPVKHGTTTVRIAFVNVSDPLALGLVTSPAQPGGNFTGLGTLSAGICGKRIDLLHMLQGARRLAVEWYAANPGQVSVFVETPAAAQAVGLDTQPHGMQRAEDSDATLADY